ncbi:hypothetical protein RHAL1_P00017 (plasmid) [Beijerinckiaceae bacterium RH AL1]|nr:hypothetical protein [Beijerinckiaceae bacterium]VVB50198.1 hypothetical protein RHCH11_RHCH11_04130 [Beijerinckiaceae bacterium RH CH11]VVB50207.1 hypothetical protein RHAL8_04127 [Beijerinckiaceae bacterium RH AL8]VVC57271.1 hypothetical protein RHAL1_P00017 [Beijerinckiaceae bacterium RH AL1]
MNADDAGLDERDLSHAVDVLKAVPSTGIAELTALAGLDPTRDFAGIDMRGWRLAQEDVRGFDFSRSDLRGTGIEKARRDETTILEGALLDHRSHRLIGPNGKGRRPRIAPESYTKVRIPDLSSAELLGRVFVIRDPLALENLVYEPPPTDLWLTYEGRYDVDEAVTCAFGHPHKKGYAFRDERGRRYLVGNSCGAKHLGMGSWKAFAKERELLEERASYLRTLRDLHDMFARNRDWIADFGNDPAVSAFDEARAVNQGRHPTLTQAVRSASANGGRLSIIVEERDFAAEERLREREARKAAETGLPAPTTWPELTRQVLRDAGVLRGRSVFAAGPPLRPELAQLTRSVDAFLKSDILTTKRDLVATSRNARTFVSRLQAAIDATLDHRSFFEPANMDLFTRWAEENRFDRCRFSIHARTVTIRPTDGSAATILQPPPKANLDTARVKELADAAAGWIRRPEEPRSTRPSRWVVRSAK